MGALLTGLALIAAACATGEGAGSTVGAPGGIRVVAAENFWGSIAAQLGGERVSVKAVLTSPDADPHNYEPTPSDARALASANLVVYNGVSYDPWVDRLLNANPSSGRVALKVQTLLGLKDDDNPHRWYSPDDVMRVIDQITADYNMIDPPHTSYFEAQRSAFVTAGLKRYNDLVQQIRQRYAGTPISATESIVTPLAEALGLRMMTPGPFLHAVSEGAEPTAQDKSTFDSQIEKKQIAVLLFNSQNATPDVQQLLDAAKAKGIPVMDVTETLDPPDAKFQDWQARQLQALATALAEATGR